MLLSSGIVRSKKVDSNNTFNIVFISIVLKCCNYSIILNSDKWLRLFLIEVIDSSNFVDSNDSLLISIFYVSTMRERVRENLYTSHAYQE